MVRVGEGPVGVNDGGWEEWWRPATVDLGVKEAGRKGGGNRRGGEEGKGEGEDGRDEGREEIKREKEGKRGNTKEQSREDGRGLRRVSLFKAAHDRAGWAMGKRRIVPASDGE